MSGLSLDLGKNTHRQPARRRPALPMVALAVLFSLLALLPLGFIVAIGIETGDVTQHQPQLAGGFKALEHLLI